MQDNKLRFQTPDPTNQDKMKEIKAAFEKRFGVDDTVRSASQWKDLVDVYGINKVAELSKLSVGAIKRKMK